MTFETKKYQVIKNAVSYELANFIYNYFLEKGFSYNICLTKKKLKEM